MPFWDTLFKKENLIQKKKTKGEVGPFGTLYV